MYSSMPWKGAQILKEYNIYENEGIDDQGACHKYARVEVQKELVTSYHSGQGPVLVHIQGNNIILIVFDIHLEVLYSESLIVSAYWKPNYLLA